MYGKPLYRQSSAHSYMYVNHSKPVFIAEMGLIYFVKQLYIVQTFYAYCAVNLVPSNKKNQ